MRNLEHISVEPISNPAANTSSIGSPRNFVLACIGVLSLLADELPALLERSVQRGNIVLERAQNEAKRQRSEKSKMALPTEFQSEISRLGLPTHHDFETLLQQVVELEKQLDQIAAQRAGTH